MQILAVVFAVLVVLGLVLQYFWWIVGAAIVLGVVTIVAVLVWDLLEDMRTRADERRRRDAALAARADRQDRWVGQGDMRGIYGHYLRLAADAQPPGGRRKK